MCALIIASTIDTNGFVPPRFAAHPWLQSTILPWLLHRVESTPRAVHRDAIVVRPSSGGGSIALDWYASPAGACAAEADAPIVLLFPGLGACASNAGFGAVLLDAIRGDWARRGRGMRTAGVIYPGCAGHALDSHKLPGSAYVSSTGDVEAIFELVRSRYPLAPLVVVGASFGSALVANWCVRRPAAAASYDIKLMLLYAYGHSVEETVWAADNDVFGGLSGASAVRMWKATFLDNPSNRAQLQRLECTHAGFRIEALERAQSVREWDAACLPAYGFETLSAMFARADPVAHFDALPPSIPVVLFNAADDWIAPSTRLDVGPYDDMPNVARVQTRVGGHLGWIDGFGLDRRRGGHCKWIVDATVRLVNGALGGWWWSANG